MGMYSRSRMTVSWEVLDSVEAVEPAVADWDRLAVEKGLSISVPTREEMSEIEASSRLYQEGRAQYMTAVVLHQPDLPFEPPVGTPITFILAGNHLVTVRYAEPRAFSIFVNRAQKKDAACMSGVAVLVGLLEAIIDREADRVERIQIEVDKLSHEIFAGKDGERTLRFDAAIRNGHGRWSGLCTTQLLPVIFMPLCSPALRDAAAGIADPAREMSVPLLGRPDWWEMWYRAMGSKHKLSPKRFGTQLAAEHLDIALAEAGQGVAIGNPILFRNQLDSHRLVPAHEFVAGDGRAFWLAYPVARQSSRKILKFRDWLCDEAASDRDGAKALIRSAVVVDP